MKLRKMISLLIAAIMLISLFGGCTNAGKGTDDPPSPGKTPAGPSAGGQTDTPAPAENTDGELVYCIDYDFVSLNPLKRMYKAEHLIANMVFDTLGTPLMDGTYDMLLAESYDISDDGLLYTFHIRDNVYFHNGEKLTAEDVAFSFNQAWSYEQNAASFINVESVAATDALTVELKMSAPYGAALPNFMNEVSIVPKAYFTEAGEAGFAEAPVGTGPFTFAERVEGVSATVYRNENYWRAPAKFSKITLTVIPDTSTAALALENGDIDALLISASEIETLSANENIEVASMPSNYLAFVILNQNKAPFDNPLVRQAVAYSLDRESMLDVLLGGYGEVNSVLCPKSVFGYSDSVSPQYSYDIEKAKELIAQSGVPTPIDGGDIICWGTTSPIAQMVQYNLSEIGIEVDIQLYEFAIALQTMQSGDFTLGTFRAGWGNDANMLQDIWATDGVVNYARLNDARIDELNALAKSETDPVKRLDYFTELLSIVNENASYLMLYDSGILVAHNSKLYVPETMNASFKLYNFYWME